MQDIQAEMHLSKRKDDGVLAYGFVTVDKLIRFPVQMRKYRDQNNEEKSFLSFPRRQTKEGGWEDVVHPDPEMRAAITEAVGEAIKEKVAKDIYMPEIDSVEVTPLKRPASHGSVYICGVATVRVGGLTIKGITVKQGEKGLFCSMPQYRSLDGQYHDIVYGTTKAMQDEISEAVLGRYKEIGLDHGKNLTEKSVGTKKPMEMVPKL